MADKYTYADVIIDPNDPRVEIKAEYYCGDTPKQVIDIANKSGTSLILDSIYNEKNNYNPFFFGRHTLDFHPCIIRKKEAKKKYIPFDFDDFTVRLELMGKTIVHNYGLDGDGEFREMMIIGFENKGDEDADDYSSNGDTKGTIAWTATSAFHADELLKECTFIDGSPCGEEVEDNTCGIKAEETPEPSYIPFDLSKPEVRDKLRDRWIRNKNGDEEISLNYFIQIIKGGEWDVNGFKSEDLLEYWVFMDGTPCGEEVKE